MAHKFISHTADIKVRAEGKDLKDAFLSCAKGLVQIISKNKIKEIKIKKIKVSGEDYPSLLYNFLEEILFLVDSQDFLVSKIKIVEFDKFKIKAEFHGDFAKNYSRLSHVKAITYNEMSIKNLNKKVVIEFVVDV